jgi:hypothetical protein
VIFRQAIITTALLLSLSSVARTEEPAVTEKQLQAAYCIPGLQATVSMQRDMLKVLEKSADKSADKSQNEAGMRADEKQRLEKMERVLGQMIAFVQALLPYPEGSPVQQAEARGIKDFNDYQAMTLRCSQKCYNAGASIDKCEDACRDKELLQRSQVCSQLANSLL